MEDEAISLIKAAHLTGGRLVTAVGEFEKAALVEALGKAEDQPRDDHGRFASGGASASVGDKAKTARTEAAHLRAQGAMGAAKAKEEDATRHEQAAARGASAASKTKEQHMADAAKHSEKAKAKRTEAAHLRAQGATGAARSAEADASKYEAMASESSKHAKGR